MKYGGILLGLGAFKLEVGKSTQQKLEWLKADRFFWLLVTTVLGSDLFFFFFFFCDDITEDNENGAHLCELYFHQISTDLDDLVIRVRKTPCPKPVPMVFGLDTCFVLLMRFTKYHPNRFSKFGGDIAQINAPGFGFYCPPINSSLNSTSQRPGGNKRPKKLVSAL